MNSKIKSVTLAGLNVLHFIPAKRQFDISLFFLHGMWSNAAMFERMLLALGELGYESYVIDLPGHGKSLPGKNIGGASLEYYIGQTEKIIAALDKQFILVGHSMGGLLSAKIAEKNLSVIGYIGLTIAPSRFVMMGSEAIKRIWKYIPALLLKREFNLNRKDAATLLFNTSSGEHLERCLDMTGKESGLAGLQIAIGLYSVKKLPCPALVIEATQDKIAPNQKAMAKKLVSNPCIGRDYAKVNCSHMVMLDKNYLQVVAEMDRWLQWNFEKNYPAYQLRKMTAVAC